jgi:hypothetical protein
VLTPQGNDEKVKRCGFLEERHPTAQAHRQQLKLGLLALTRDEQLFESPLIKPITSHEVERHDPIQLLSRHEKRVADKIVDNIAVGAKALETQRQELKVGCRGEGARVLKAGHGG